MYILDKIENELGFSIGFDEKEKKFKLSNQSEKQLSKTNLDSIIYKINIYDKENKEKLNIELLHLISLLILQILVHYYRQSQD